MAINIDTTAPAYQQYLNGLDSLRTLMTPRFKVFAKLPRDKQKLWLQRDPLFRKLLKMGLDISEWSEQFKEDTVND